MDFLLLLTEFIILGAGIKVGVSFWNLMLKPFIDLKKYSLIEAFILSSLITFSYNISMYEALGINKEVSLQPMFHYVSLFVTALILRGGANGVHKFIKLIKNSLSKEEK